MHLVTRKFRIALRAMLAADKGQDLVEYGMIIALLSLGTVAGFEKVSSAIAAIFGKLATILYVALR